MAEEERHRLLDRLAALHRGRLDVDSFYVGADVDQLRHALASAEVAQRDIECHGRLGAIWREAGGILIEKE